MQKNTIIATIVLILGLGAAFVWLQADADTPAPTHSNTTGDTYLATSTLPLAVAGSVTAADSATIYAQTAGVVEQLPYREGSAVAAQQILAVQSTPVAAAQSTLAAAQRDLVVAEQRAAVAARTAAADVAVVRQYSAAEFATLRADNNERRVAEATRSLDATVETHYTTILGALDFINTNRSLFTAEGLRWYTDVTERVYGTTPTYLTTELRAGSRDGVVSLQTLVAEPVRTFDTSYTASQLTQYVLLLLDDIFATGERAVLDRRIAMTESTKTTYFAEKQAVTTALRDVIQVHAGAQATFDGVLEDAIVQDEVVTVAASDERATALQAALATAIADRAAAVQTAAVGVRVTEQNLGRVTAPFSGWVSHVLVQEGEYVMPGTPLLTLVGDGGRELIVTVPASLADQVRSGDAFVVSGETVGFVDRVGAAQVGQSVTVVIALQSDQFSVGQTVRGVIDVTPADTVYAVPRPFVFFDSAGAYITFANTETSRIEIVYDAGDRLYAEVVSPQERPLRHVQQRN